MTGHRQQSQSKMETTADGRGPQVLLYSSRQLYCHCISWFTPLLIEFTYQTV